MAGPIITEALVAGLGIEPGVAGQIFAAEALGTALGPVAAAFWMPRVKWRTAAIVAILVVIAGNVVSGYLALGRHTGGPAFCCRLFR